MDSIRSFYPHADLASITLCRQLWSKIRIHTLFFSLLLQALLSACSMATEDTNTSSSSQKANDFSTPEQAIRSFCELDAAGERLYQGTIDKQSRVQNLVRWDLEPDWKTIVIVNGFTIGQIRLVQGCALVPVTYDVSGRYSADRTMFYRAQEKISFRLVKTGNGWKIDEPLVSPHTRSTALIRILQNRIQISDSVHEKQKLQKDIYLLKNIKRFSPDRSLNAL